MITDGKRVTIRYTVILDDGTEVDSSADEPMIYTHGHGELLPALEASMVGLSIGQKHHLRLNPEEAYGPIEDEAYQQVALSIVPESLRTVGAPIAVEDDNGETFKARVHKIAGDTATIDFNHPLAGQSLTFDIEVLDIQEPSKQN